MRRYVSPLSSLLMGLIFVPLVAAARIPQTTIGSRFDSSRFGVSSSAEPHASTYHLSFGLRLAHAQSTAILQGRVMDQNGAVLPAAQITARQTATGLERLGETDSLGNYQIAARTWIFSIIKNTKLDEKRELQFRAEVFDLFNHANFGQPGRIVGSATFGQITNTRFPTGDSGSSRQLQFALKLEF